MCQKLNINQRFHFWFPNTSNFILIQYFSHFLKYPQLLCKLVKKKQSECIIPISESQILLKCVCLCPKFFYASSCESNYVFRCMAIPKDICIYWSSRLVKYNSTNEIYQFFCESLKGSCASNIPWAPEFIICLCLINVTQE